MSAKLLLYPLHTEEHLHHHDHHHQARHRDSQADTATLIKSLAAEAAMYDRQGDNHHHDLENLSPTDSERSADTKPGHISGNGKMELDLNKELPAAAQPKRRDIVFPLRGDADWSRDGGDPTAREMKSPDIHKLKVVRAEVDGQYVWAVSRISYVLGAIPILKGESLK